MEQGILKKRLNTFKSAKGTLKRVSDEVIMEVLRAWESWPETSKGFYQGLGLSKQQLAILIKKGKSLIKSGAVSESEFREIKVENSGGVPTMPCAGAMILKWEKGKHIEFSKVDQLVDFLKKVA